MTKSGVTKSEGIILATHVETVIVAPKAAPKRMHGTNRESVGERPPGTMATTDGDNENKRHDTTTTLGVALREETGTARFNGHSIQCRRSWKRR